MLVIFKFYFNDQNDFHNFTSNKTTTHYNNLTLQQPHITTTTHYNNLTLQQPHITTTSHYNNHTSISTTTHPLQPPHIPNNISNGSDSKTAIKLNQHRLPTPEIRSARAISPLVFVLRQLKIFRCWLEIIFI